MDYKILILFVSLILLCNPASAGSLKPADHDDDGLYEDLNGNGILDFDDVVTLSYNLKFLNPVKFDFNGNGILDFGDVVKLYDYVY